MGPETLGRSHVESMSIVSFYIVLYTCTYIYIYSDGKIAKGDVHVL